MGNLQLAIGKYCRFSGSLIDRESRLCLLLIACCLLLIANWLSLSGTIAQKKACGNCIIQKYLVKIGLEYSTSSYFC